jgi:hypothetical protein
MKNWALFTPLGESTLFVVLVEDESLSSVSEDVDVAWVSLVGFRTDVYCPSSHLVLVEKNGTPYIKHYYWVPVHW